MNKIILHVDMDSFYASVEEREHPAYKGKPVVVGADPKEGTGRGVVSTCNYAARKFGIHSAMPISQAWKRCPSAVFVQPDFALYESVSEQIMALARPYAGAFMQVSIDEAFLDITTQVRDYEEARQHGTQLKQAIHQQTGLTCSVGIGPNRLIAKIASDFQKPNGLIVVEPSEVLEFIAPLGVRKLYGVGPKTEEHLRKMGIETVAQLRALSPTRLQAEFGAFGLNLAAMAQGQYDDTVEESWKIKSISRHVTLEQDTTDKQVLLTILQDMSKVIEAQLKSYDMAYKTVTLMVRYATFVTHTSSRTLTSSVTNSKPMRTVAEMLLKKYLTGKKIRLIGLRVSGLSETRHQRTLIQ